MARLFFRWNKHPWRVNSISKDLKIATITFPWVSNVPYKFLSEIIEILDPISGKIFLITGNTYRIESNSKKMVKKDLRMSIHKLRNENFILYSLSLWILKCIFIQARMSSEIISLRKEIDLIIFYMAYPYHLLPLLVSKIVGIRTIEIITRSKGKSICPKAVDIYNYLLFSLLDGISPESNKLIEDLDLMRYESKLLPEGARFINTDYFRMVKDLEQRKCLVGFIGRLVDQKGIRNFVKSIPLIAEENNSISFLIGGSGILFDWVNEECKKIADENNVRIIVAGWLGDDLIYCLNELKLLVVPSYEDAFPTIILEAMSCGTPVLATPVGAISSLIKDTETGFILENNTPECISKNVIRALNFSDLGKISAMEQKLIKMNYTYDAAVNRYESILGYASTAGLK